MGSGGGVEYEQSPEQRQIYQALVPAIGKLQTILSEVYDPISEQQWQVAKSGDYPTQAEWIAQNWEDFYNPHPLQQIFGGGGKRLRAKAREQAAEAYPYAGFGDYGQFESYEDYLQDYDQDFGQLYRVPETPQLQLPTEEWWGNLSPAFKEGLWAPYNQGAQQMLSQMGGRTGSPRGGYSGSAATALSDFYSQATPKVAQQGWNMGLMDYETQKEDWRQRIAARQQPWAMVPGMLGGTYSTPYVTPAGPSTGQTIGNVGAGAMMGYGALQGTSIGGPWGAAIGAGVGLLSSLFQ